MTRHNMQNSLKKSHSHFQSLKRLLRRFVSIVAFVFAGTQTWFSILENSFTADFPGKEP